jgi:hypothetical protein
MPIINPNNPNVNIAEQQQMAQIANLLKISPDMECEKCKSRNFMQIFRIKKISGLASGTGKDVIVPIGIYGCAECGHVNEYFLDKLKNDGTEETK